MKVSFKKQMLQYQSRKYVSEIRMFILPLVLVYEFFVPYFNKILLFSIDHICVD